MNKVFRVVIVLIAIGIALWGFSSTYIWYFRYSKEDRELTNLTEHLGNPAFPRQVFDTELLKSFQV